MNIKKTSMAVTAMIAAAVMALAGCGSSSNSADSSASSKKSDAFVLGGLWPETGSLSYLAPPELAAEKLAVADINAAGGVLGKDVTTVDADTSDADHADQNSSATQSVMSKNPSFVIGPASSSVVKNVYKTITSAKVPMLSMGATSSDFSGLSPYFFRTVPPDSVQGAVLGQVIAQDGVKNLAIAAFNEEYGTGLRDTIAKTASDAGVNIVYGEKDAFDQTKSLVKELASQGVDTHKLYFVDGNTADHSKDLDAGLLKGTKGTIPGVMASDDFQKKLVKAYGKDIDNFTYGAETYDGIILAALAAEKGGSADGETIQKNMAAVSGATGGDECTTYKDCVAAIKDGKDIKYKGLTGIGAFNKNNDPSSANIGVYVFDGDNKPVFDHTQEGKVPTD